MIAMTSTLIKEASWSMKYYTYIASNRYCFYEIVVLHIGFTYHFDKLMSKMGEENSSRQEYDFKKSKAAKLWLSISNQDQERLKSIVFIYFQLSKCKNNCDCTNP